MKGKLYPILLAAAISPATNAGVLLTYFPAEPEVTAPADESIDVSTNPTIESSAMLEIDQNGNSATGQLVFSSAQWQFYERDDSLTILGGVSGSDTVMFDAIPEQSFDYVIPENLTLTFDGTTTASLKIFNTGKVQLLSDASAVIAEVIAQPDSLSQMRPKADGRINVKALDNAISIQWGFVPTSYGNEATVEVTIANNGNILVRTSPNDLSSDFFTAINSVVSGTIGSDTISKSLVDWKTTLENNSLTQFGLVFNQNPDDNNALRAQIPTDVIISQISEPSFSSVAANDTSYELPSDFLRPATEYTVQVRHIAADQNSEIRNSNWSDAVNFTTALNTSYTITSNGTTTITQGEPTDFTFTINSTGEHSGIPRVEVKLPFNALSNLNGTLSDFFDGKVTAGADEGVSCRVSVVANETFLICDNPMDADTSMTFEATATFNTAGSQNIEYRVCESRLNRCDGVEFTPLAINVTATGSTGNNSSETTETESSSGGGSMFWLTILALPLLRLRRRTA